MAWTNVPGSDAMEWQPDAASYGGLLGGLSGQDKTLALGLLGLGMLGGNYGRNKREAMANAFQGGMQGGLTGLNMATQAQAQQRRLGQADQELGMRQQGLDIQKQQALLHQQQIEAAMALQKRQQEENMRLQALRAQAGQMPGQPVSLAPTQANADAMSAGNLPRRSEMDAVDFLRRNGDFAGAENFQKTMPKNTGAPISVQGPGGIPTLYQGQEYGAPRPLGLAPYEASLDPRLIEFAVKKQNALLPGEIAKAAAGRTSVSLSVDTGKKYGETFATKLADADVQLRDAASKAPELAQRAQAVKGLLNSGQVITGFGADYRLAFGKAAQAAGINLGGDAISNTEVLSTELAKNTLDAIKASGLGGGTGFSNADRDFLEKAVGGKITLEANTIRRLADLSERAAIKSAEKWQQRSKTIPPDVLNATGLAGESFQVPQFGGGLPTQAPAQSQSQGGGTLSAAERAELEQLRKRFNRR